MSRSSRLATAMALVILATAATAAPPEEGRAPAGLGFLEAGKDYVVRFPEGSDLFKVSRAGVSETTYTTADGQKKSGAPATWNVTFSVNVFQVVRFGGGSWVLLRHPTKSDDFLRWSEQRRAKAILAGPRVKAIEAGPDGQARLKRLREAAEVEVPTSETWFNLDHAIAIAAVPTEEDDPKLSVKSIKIEPR